MILVAATAIGCGLTALFDRASQGHLSIRIVWSELPAIFSQMGIVYGAVGVSAIFVAAFGPFVATWTLALVGLRLLGPRPRWNRVCRQPGLIAGCAGGLALAAVGLYLIGVALVTGTDSLWNWSAVEGIYFASPMFVGLAVLSSWMTLLLVRRWRAERTWVDRLGRAAGCYWIIASILMLAMMFLQQTSQLLANHAPVGASSPEQVALQADAVEEAGSPLASPAMLIAVPR
jgi:hypothetical protein